MLLTVLAWYTRTVNFTTPYWNKLLQSARDWLGPTPQRFLILEDGQVLPSTMHIPASLRASTYVYNPETNRIALLEDPEPAGRFRPLHYLSAELRHAIVGSVDISDWLEEIRANPVPQTIPIKQLFHLYGLVQNRYIPVSDGVEVMVTTSDGETITTRL